MTTRIIFRVIVTLVALLAAVSTGCSGCSKDHIAELKKHKGDVTRDTSSSQQTWEPASDGTKLSLGDGLKTGPTSDAVVVLTSGGAIAVSSDTTIRFVASAPGSQTPKLSVETGEASIEAAGDQGLRVQTMFGLAQIEPGGKLRVSADGSGAARFEVTVGSAKVETEDGGLSLSPGKAFDVSLGGAIIERESVDATTDAGAKAEDAAPAPPVVDTSGASTTIDVHGAGVRIASRDGKEWKPLAEGAATASSGDALEVPNGASVDVRRGSRSARLVGFGRYVISDAGGSSLVRVRSGHAELQATSEDASVEVPGGTVTAKGPGAGGKSRVDADVAAAGTKVGVRQGQGEVRGSGAAETVRAGENATLTAKGAVVVSSRGPERPDFTIHAGDSIVVRDPRPPTALGFDFSSVCPSAGVVSRADGRATARGEHTAALSLAAGRHAYAVRCIGPDGIEEKPAATGNVTVVADAARAALPRLPPSTTVDMDGRRYTVLYQNRLPSVTARWPGAPPSSAYSLSVGGQRTKTKAPKLALKPGRLGEGTHMLRFETEDGTKKSPETTLIIKFDNAAPAASVREPVDGSFRPGDTVKVSGVVVEGWTVSVNGAAVPLDAEKRFGSTATVPPGENGLVLKLSHPTRGTVYYVRHAGGVR